MRCGDLTFCAKSASLGGQVRTQVTDNSGKPDKRKNRLFSMIVQSVLDDADLKIGIEFARGRAESCTPTMASWEQIKYVSKVRGQLCDSHKSYIASVTIHPEGRQFHATDKICKKVQEIVYWCGH